MFVFKKDFVSNIRDSDLQQLIEANEGLLAEASLVAQTEMEHHLQGRYLVNEIFSPISPYVPGQVYTQGARVILQAAAYDSQQNYKAGNMVESAGLVYRCIMQHTGQPTSDKNYWAFVAAQDSLFFAKIDTSKALFTEDWQQGDLRDPLIKKYLIDIAIYHLYCRISPRLIPVYRKELRDQAIMHIEKIGMGKLKTSLPIKEEDQANQLMFGSSSTRQSNYF